MCSRVLIHSDPKSTSQCSPEMQSHLTCRPSIDSDELLPTCACTSTSTSTSTCTSTCTCTCTCNMHMHMQHAHAHAHMHMHICTCTYAHAHMHISHHDFMCGSQRDMRGIGKGIGFGSLVRRTGPRPRATCTCTRSRRARPRTSSQCALLRLPPHRPACTYTSTHKLGRRPVHALRPHA